MAEQLSLYRNYTNSDSVFVNNEYSVFPDPSEFGWAKEGCVFKYWSTEKDDSLPLSRYNAGDSVPFVMLSFTLYAIWEEVYTTTGNELKSVADAIRTKGGTSELLAYPSGFISAIENLPSGGGGENVTIETGIYTPSANKAKPTISFSKTHSKLPVFAAMIDADGYISTSNSNISWYYVNWEQLIGGAIYPSADSTRYGEVRYSYRGSNASSITSSTGTVSHFESNTGTSSVSYPRFSVNESGMMPYCGGSARYWRAGRTYKWIAVWQS